MTREEKAQEQDFFQAIEFFYGHADDNIYFEFLNHDIFVPPPALWSQHIH